MTEDIKRDNYTTEDEAYFRSEVEHARRQAKGTVAEFVTQTDYLGFHSLIDHVKNNSLDEPEKKKLTDLLGALGYLNSDLDDELLQWARKEQS
jgi:hypothetical protein